MFGKPLLQMFYPSITYPLYVSRSLHTLIDHTTVQYEDCHKPLYVLLSDLKALHLKSPLNRIQQILKLENFLGLKYSFSLYM